MLLKNNNVFSLPATLRKLPFLFFCWLSFALFTLIAGFVFYLIVPRLLPIPGLLYIVGGAASLSVVILGGGLFLLTLTALTGWDLLYPHGQPSITVTLLFPIAATLSQIFRYNRTNLRGSFVAVNNAMTIAQRRRIRGDRVLVLLPHCLQIDICNRKITGDINNCLECGRCTVGELLVLGRRYGLKLEVVNGGTLARSRVKSFRPDGIVAVACERDLTFGIQDVYPIPVYGVINDRPNGPCHNTCVNIASVEEAVRFFKYDSKTNVLNHNLDFWSIKAPFYQRIRHLWPWSQLLHSENSSSRKLLMQIDKSPITVLDIGCGTGNVRTFLPVSSFYIGIDICFGMACQSHKKNGDHIIQADLQTLPVRMDKVDCITAVGVLEYFDDPAYFLNLIVAPMVAGSYLLVTSSPPGIISRLRSLSGSRVHACQSEALRHAATGCGLAPIAQGRTLMQEQFLFVKK